MIQFAGIYNIVSVRKEDGTELEGDLKDKALSSYFLKSHQSDKWTGLRGGSASADGKSTRFFSHVKENEFYLAIDDQAGQDGTEAANKVGKIRGEHLKSWHDATMVLFTAPFARAFLSARGNLYAKPALKRFIKKFTDKATPAELVVTTSQKNLFDTQVENVKVLSISG